MANSKLPCSLDSGNPCRNDGLAYEVVPYSEDRRNTATVYGVLCDERQNAIVDRAHFHALRLIVIAVAFGAGFFTDFEHDRAFLDRIGRADRFTISAGNTFFGNNI
jgi:hypothetical protein